MHVKTRGWHQFCHFSISFHLSFGDRIFHQAWSSLIQVNWLAHVLQRSTYLCLPNAEITDVLVHICAWVLGIPAQVFSLLSQPALLDHSLLLYLSRQKPLKEKTHKLRVHLIHCTVWHIALHIVHSQLELTGLNWVYCFVFIHGICSSIPGTSPS